MKKSNLNLSYHEQDGVLLPNICISDQTEDEQPLGRYGRMALAYLREKIRYNKLRKLKIAEKVDTACRSLVE